MKKSFYDLMNDYEPKNADLIEYSVNADSVKKKVMNMIGSYSDKKKYRFTKKTFAVITTASIAAVTGIAAAAYETGLFENAVSFFENHTYTESSQDLNENNYTAISSNLKKENIAMESNGASVELIGSMHDENVIYLFCRMTLPENIVLEETKYCLFKQVTFEEPDNTGHKDKGVRSIEVLFPDDDIPDDNTLNFICTVEVGGNADIDDLNGIILRDLCISSHEIISSVNGDRLKTKPVLNGHWYIPLDYSQENPMKEFIKEPLDIKITDNSGTTGFITVNSLTVSSLSMKIGTVADDSFMLPVSMQDYVSIIMKDGSSLNSYNSVPIIGDQKENTETIVLEKPIDVSQISYIKIGDTEIRPD